MVVKPKPVRRRLWLVRANGLMDDHRLSRQMREFRPRTMRKCAVRLRGIN